MSASSSLSAEKVIVALSHDTRWQILAVLAKGDGLPADVIARRVGKSPVTTAQHLRILQNSGMLKRGHGKLYWIPKQFRIEGQPMTLDFGPTLVRLDRLEER